MSVFSLNKTQFINEELNWISFEFILLVGKMMVFPYLFNADISISIDNDSMRMVDNLHCENYFTISVSFV